MEEGCKLHALAALTPAQYPLDNRLDGPRNRSGSFGEEKIKFRDRLSTKVYVWKLVLFRHSYVKLSLLINIMLWKCIRGLPLQLDQ